jgi:hypothetical protein
MLQIEWNGHLHVLMSTEDWATRLSQDTEWGDDVFLSLASHVLNRRIIILSFKFKFFTTATKGLVK